MPNLACRTCGRVVYSTVPLDQLFAEERRCPRCGAMLQDERRAENRRKRDRRASLTMPFEVGGADRRITDRRQHHRRHDDARTFATFAAP
jgi:hypothetical protein